jgi:hypothetical protein
VPAFLIPWLLRGLALLAVIAALYGAWWKVDHWCNSSCADATDRAVAAEDRIAEAQRRATALALLWSAAVDKLEIAHVESRRISEHAAVQLRERARRIASRGDSGTIRVDPDAGRLLRDSADFANRTPAAEVDSRPAEAVPDAARDTTLAQWTEFAIAAAEAYRDAADKHQACVAFVGAISEAQASGASE